MYILDLAEKRFVGGEFVLEADETLRVYKTRQQAYEAAKKLGMYYIHVSNRTHLLGSGNYRTAPARFTYYDIYKA